MQIAYTDIHSDFCTFFLSVGLVKLFILFLLLFVGLLATDW